MQSNLLRLRPQQLTVEQLKQVYFQQTPVVLSNENDEKIQASCDLVQQKAVSDEAVYGINTGFGLLANTKIAKEGLATLQKNLILSHSAGVGKPLHDQVVGLILILKACSLAAGYSGSEKSTHQCTY